MNIPKKFDQSIKKSLAPLVERLVKCEGMIESRNVHKLSDHGSENDSYCGLNDNMGDFNDIPINVIQITGAIKISFTNGRFVFHITETMIQFLQMKGILVGLDHEDLHEHLRNFKKGLIEGCKGKCQSKGAKPKPKPKAAPTLAKHRPSSRLSPRPVVLNTVHVRSREDPLAWWKARP
uniref:Uncharacterized protein n=1 Tax=Solanum tuberosum TaxID=4113 RepID=M1DRT4_SOLTU